MIKTAKKITSAIEKDSKAVCSLPLTCTKSLVVCFKYKSYLITTGYDEKAEYFSRFNMCT